MATLVAGKYELLEVLHDAGIRTCRARQVTLGHVVMVHFIPGSQGGDDFALLDRLAQLPELARRLFFDAGEHESVPYVVSWPLTGFDSLPAWLERTIEKNRPQPKAAPGAPKAATTDPSEFSRLFFNGMKESPAPPSVKEPPPSQAVKEPPPPPKEPGEFTRLFQVPATVKTPPRAPAGPPPAPASSAPAPAPPASGPGEFTQFFQRGATGEPRQPNPHETEILPASPFFPSPGRAAEHSLETVDWGVPPAPATPRPKPPAASPRAPGPPAAAPSPIQAPAGNVFSVPPPPSVPEPPRLTGGDDYEKVFARPAAPPLPPVVPPMAPKPAVQFPPPPQVPRPARSAYRPMWIALAVLFVLAIALTLFLALRG
jgi:hypothetical protein